METELGCGVATHDKACLCDVVITQPLPPLEQCVRNGVDDLFMGKELVALRGYSAPWNNQTTLAYFEDLVKFYDAYHDGQKSGYTAKHLGDVPRLVYGESDTAYEKWGKVRECVQYCMDMFDTTLVEILQHIGVTAEEFMDAATTAKAGKTWDYNNIEHLDGLFNVENLNFNEVARQSGLTLEVVRGIRRYWDERRKRLVGSDNPARDYFHDLCRNTTLGGAVIARMVKERYPDVNYHSSSVSKYRNRMVNKYNAKTE